MMNTLAVFAWTLKDVLAVSVTAVFVGGLFVVYAILFVVDDLVKIKRKLFQWLRWKRK